MNFKTLKKLTILSLIILALPFFQTCSDKNIMANDYLRNSPRQELVEATTDSVNKREIDLKLKEFRYTSKELADKKREGLSKFLIVKKDMTNNGYQLGFLFIQTLEVNNFFDSIDYGFLPFFLTIIITALLVYFAFKRKEKVILFLSALNLLLLMAHLIILYCSSFLEDIEQIKFGYYLFIINLILIFIEAYKIMKTERCVKKM